MERATLKDIAVRAKVSITAVSRALNGYDDIGEETRNRIIEIAKELNYQPNFTARSLVTQRSGVMGLFVLGRVRGEGFSHPFSGQIITGILDELTSRGYDLMVFSATRPPAEGEPSYVDLCRRRSVEGAFFMGLRLDDPWLPLLKSSPFPIAVLDMALMGRNTHSIGIDNVAGAYDAVRHLVDLGHARIGFINGYDEAMVSHERLQGYKAALLDRGLDYDASLVASGDFTAEGAERALRELVQRSNDITAVFCASDLMATGAMKAASDLGLSVPQDLSIVGFDDIDLASVTSPPLTTVSQPRYELGETAGRVLVDACSGLKPPSRVLLKATLVVRGTTCSPLKAR
jgi:DNA-binding LacI/PurR family transcriptional regulator